MQDEFKRWARNHALIFGFTEQQELMALSWNDIFVARAYSLDELRAATAALADRPPAYAGMHLAAIHDAIQNVRAVDYHKETQATMRSQCSLCGNSGRVVVPHINGIKEGEWAPIATTRAGAGYYTMAVLCSCPAGERHGQRLGTDRHGKARQMMSLDAYSLNNPDWQAQMKSRERHQQATAEVNMEYLGILNPADDTHRKGLENWWSKFKQHVAARFKRSKENLMAKTNLPGMELPSIPELDEASELYRKIRDSRMRMLEKEIEAQAALLRMMHEHKQTCYEYEGYQVVLDSKEKVKVKSKPEAENGDLEE